MTKRKRKKSGKTKRKPARSKKRGAPRKGAPLFSRSTKQTNTGSASAWTKWGRQRSQSDPTASRRRHVQRILESRGVAPPVAHKIAYGMDPDRFYVMRIYGYAGSDLNDDSVPGDIPVLQAQFVGSGAYNWTRAMGYASRAPIEEVDIEELDGAVIDRPFWFDPRYSVKTVSGERVYGHGSFEEWRDRLKTGRPKKAGGGMTAGERRKNRKSKRDALKRRQALRARVEALKKQGKHIEANRLLERSKRSRKVDL